MQNCKHPNNGNNVIKRADGKLELYDMSGNKTSVDDWSADISRLEAAIDAKAEPKLTNAHVAAWIHRLGMVDSLSHAYTSEGIRITGVRQLDSTRTEFTLACADGYAFAGSAVARGVDTQGNADAYVGTITAHTTTATFSPSLNMTDSFLLDIYTELEEV